MEAPDAAKYANPSLIVKQFLNKDSEGVIVTSSKEGLQWLEKLINSKIPTVRTATYKTPPNKWTALNLMSLHTKSGVS